MVLHVDKNKTNFAISAERPIAIVDGPASSMGTRYWQWITVAEATQLVADLQAAIAEHEQLVADLQAAIAEHEPVPQRPPRPQPKYDSSVWERRRDRKWWRRMYESGRS